MREEEGQGRSESRRIEGGPAMQRDKVAIIIMVHMVVEDRGYEL
jgi:hypothetical protein